jgi:hypothetical protein
MNGFPWTLTATGRFRAFDCFGRRVKTGSVVRLLDGSTRVVRTCKGSALRLCGNVGALVPAIHVCLVDA